MGGMTVHATLRQAAPAAPQFLGAALRRDEEADALAAALADLRHRASACCGAAASSDTGAAPEAIRRDQGASPARGRHRSKPTSRRFVLPEVTVVEPTVRSELADVLVTDGRIADVLPPRSGPYAGYDVLSDYRGSFVLPALTDMHSHLPPDNLLGLMDLFLLLFLTHGVTTIRDAGDTDGTSLPAYQQGMKESRFIGPRSFAAGPFVNKGPTRWTNTLQIRSPGDAQGIARELLRRGARCMKIYENLSVEDIAALERAAAEHGLMTLGHVPTKLGIEEARLADAQHFFGVAPPASLPRDHVLDRLCWWERVDDKRMEVVVRSAVEGRLANTPTLVVVERLLAAGPEGHIDDPSLDLLPRFFRDVIWHPQIGLPAYRRPDQARVQRLTAAQEKRLELVRRLYQAGATLRIGTDWQSFVVQGDALHREMKLFEQAGIPTAVVLRMATRDAALALGQQDLGTVRKGAIADLICCSADPTKDLSALRSMRAVCHQGAIYSAQTLWDELRERLRAYDRTFVRLGAAILARLAMWATARRFTG
jgi:cytosine/adenosine deaminase-related metal-dependent hydrolase